MQNEIEAQFLEVNKEEMRQKLQKIGATLVKPEVMMRRVIFDIGPRQFIRVRDEGDKIVMTYKKIENDKSIMGVKEVNVVVDDFERAVVLLKGAGLKVKAHQETLRELWRDREVEICLDTWPWIPSFIEVEGPSEEAVWATVKKLGLNRSEAKFGAADSIYNHYYGVEREVVNSETPVISFDCTPPEWVNREILEKLTKGN